MIKLFDKNDIAQRKSGKGEEVIIYRCEPLPVGTPLEQSKHHQVSKDNSFQRPTFRRFMHIFQRKARLPVFSD